MWKRRRRPVASTVDEPVPRWTQRQREQWIGRRIDRVRYLDRGVGFNAERYAEPTWRDQHFDWPEEGLELDLDDGTTRSFYWDVTGNNEAVLIGDGPLVGSVLVQDAHVEVSDVTAEWHAAGMSHIAEITPVWWRDATYLGVGTYVLTFATDAQAIITLGSMAQDGSLATSATSIVVFFSHAHAVNAGVKPLPGQPDAIT